MLKVNHLFRFVMGLLFVVLTHACSEKSSMEYLKWVEQNKDFAKISTDSIVVMNCHYRPAKYMAIRELLKNIKVDTIAGLNSEMVLKEELKFEKGLYFDVRFRLCNGENIVLAAINDRNDYAIRIDYLNQTIYQDFFLLLDDMSKVQAIGHSFQNSFGMSNTCDITLVFPNNESVMQSDNIELIYEDRIFGFGKNQWRFSFEDDIK